MANEPATHFQALKAKKRVIDEVLGTRPSEPVSGDFYFESNTNRWVVYSIDQWVYAAISTTTSTSTTTTSTSTSTTTTSTSTSTTTSTSTSTSTSTTTTL